MPNTAGITEFCMMSEQDIIGELERLGYKNAEIRGAMKDVGMIIVGRALAAYLQTLPEDERAKLQALSPEEMEAYLAKHPQLPPFSQASFDAIHDDTWREYFAAMA